MRGHARFKNCAAGGVDVLCETICSRLKRFYVKNGGMRERGEGGSPLVAAIIVYRKAGEAFTGTKGDADLWEPIDREGSMVSRQRVVKGNGEVRELIRENCGGV